jgi:RNA-directed DNA polymerase
MEVLNNTTGASPSIVGQWNSINWPQCYKNTEKRQARIVKAIEAGRWNKAKALQHLLVHMAGFPKEALKKARAG